jgi:hypothetical protein
MREKKSVCPAPASLSLSLCRRYSLHSTVIHQRNPNKACYSTVETAGGQTSEAKKTGILNFLHQLLSSFGASWEP